MRINVNITFSRYHGSVKWGTSMELTKNAAPQTTAEKGQVKARPRFQLAKQYGGQRIVSHNVSVEDLARITAARAYFGSLRETIVHLFPGALVNEGLD
ncbi:MAG: hypothetical protein WAM02_11130 [Candidatus Cybelea sp.]